MGFLRKVAALILTSIFFSSLLFIAYGWTFNETVANSSSVKGWVEQSGAYDSFVSELVKTSAEQAKDQINESSLDTDTLIAAANNSFTPERLQNNFETLLDGFYAWLDGQSETIQFTIDFRDEIEDFRSNIVDRAEARLMDLPTCTTLPDSLDVDPFKAACLPPNVDIQALLSDFKTRTLDDDFTPVEPIISADDITRGDPENGEAKPLESTVSFLPPAWQIAKLGAVIAIAAAVISAGLLYVLASNKRRLLTRFGRGFLFGALTLGIFTFFTARSDNWLEGVFSQDEAASTFASNVIQPIISRAVADISFWTFRFFTVYAAVAILLFILYYYHGYERREHKRRLFKEPPEHLEKHYRKIATKKPKKYKKNNTKRKEALKKKVTNSNDKKTK